MENLNITSAQYALFFKQSLNQDNCFLYAEKMKQHMEQHFNPEKIKINIPRFDLSPILFRLTYDNSIITHVSPNRCDIVYGVQDPIHSSQNYLTIMANIRNWLSDVFSFFYQEQKILRIGIVVNYMLIDEKQSPSILLENLFKEVAPAISTSITRLETQKKFTLNGFTINNLWRIWNGVYNSATVKDLPNVGIVRDINIAEQTQPLSIEQYDSFLKDTESYFSKESILNLEK